MANRENISVSFTPEQAQFLADCVASGRYQSASEVVREAIRLLEDQETHRQLAIERAQQMLEKGARQLDAGEEIDSASVFGELARKYERLARNARAK
ncbi:MAG: type II toxin-antitoxin system ParD family antitoxin [Planctomycetota bacterium]|jgi:antitoxin ParD1/3/4